MLYPPAIDPCHDPVSPNTLARPLGTNAQSQENCSADEEHARCQPDVAQRDATVFSLQLAEPDDQGNVRPMETNAHSPGLPAGETRAEFQPGAGGGPDSPVGERSQCDSDDSGGENGPHDMSVDDHRGMAAETFVPRFGASLNPVRCFFSLFSLLTCSLGGSI